MNATGPFSDRPGGGTTMPAVDAASSPGLQVPKVRELPWANAVWLAPDACLLQNPVPRSGTDLSVVQVVGVVDCGDWPGAVLMLG